MTELPVTEHRRRERKWRKRQAELERVTKMDQDETYYPSDWDARMREIRAAIFLWGRDDQDPVHG